ncbi:4-hydroxythreonine-4-phosphate dehydrogenase PdxA [Burkholderia glumae]|uniref:4-hydroxythreonine-4-phosphate dehydrogenase PdxA n=1 Tax=Burkholderia glumae TaxID=337 RepID=UPI000F5EEECF|nr:4-hydroxythreonine-4-phosphate dehydrogenase PdxA [Burkholderia glumae]MCQ0033059.1 4-hydroxythreonine-4-phosphate dehydrogenase PdxA [Burkholderia glumae]MCQ0038083.1 4-hydroxythreonine-4-phosphate dehydrogenase PdxA [Burkholderia glumae]QJW80678.1 4-hydroxythreonine-4-phosphate dehydrogenase PdxA [Burkholderia glumae]RQZ67646.1 4-hydroxythreonine-4-phosphate dehydrogenase PdxA [Burkholderia glumae]UVS84090.1 4-hydroxythreonine-4-phosphate dehydrogenase PdxA [Burkholderia glumae]
MRTPRLLMLGDDLSGTADCAVTGTQRGLASLVCLDAAQALAGAAAAAEAASADVLAIDTDSRRASPAEAGRANAEAWRAHAAGRRVYKKIDSTLRGNVAAEVAALAAHAGMAIVAPALPEAGRTVVDGRLLVRGTPVEATELWRNEGIEGGGQIPAMLAGAGLNVAHLDIEAVREGAAALRARLDAQRARGVHAVVCDSETDRDLGIVAQASAELDGVFWVGSAGLARTLIAALPGADEGARAAQPHAPATAGQARDARGVLVVVGSMSSVSHAQIEALRSAAAEAFDCFSIDVAALLDPSSAASLTLGRRVSDALTRGRHVIVAMNQAQRAHPAVAAQLAAQLAARLAPAVAHAGALVATGGETARALLAAVGVQSLRVIEELEPGVPLLAATGTARVPAVATKAGGFGAPDTLYRVWRRLAHAHPDTTRSTESCANRKISNEEAMTYRPVIGITMGDAAGVGPEIIMKSLAHQSVYEGCRPLVIGDAKRLADAARRANVALEMRSIATPADARFQFGVVDCIDLGLIPEALPYGQLSPVAGDAAYQYLARTVALTSAGELDAICTAPLNKEALHAGGHIFPGHTEMLAHLTGIPEVSMMLVAPKLRVIHVTTHIGLLDAIRKIEPGLVQRTIERAHDTLVRAGIEAPRIGVCGINPHAGENGLFGYGEEEEKIMPAVGVLRERGWNVEGPLPADTLFFRAGRGDFDVVVAMYHDQGHGPVKVMGLEAGVNVTVGLPVIRTSVDHGTAFDIAGRGVADERSMLEALKQAKDLATRRAVHAA